MNSISELANKPREELPECERRPYLMDSVAAESLDTRLQSVIVGECQSVPFVRYSNMSENLSQHKQLDRRISAAPMMDWTDGVDFVRRIKWFLGREIVCLLYVSSFLMRRSVRR